MQFDQLRRREFITLLGGAAAWPLAARAQQPAMPVVGFLESGSAEPAAQYAAAFRRGLDEYGYVEGQNITIEYRWANGQYDRLRAMAAELVRRPVVVIAATGSPNTAQAAKAATTTIPIVFANGGDPVDLGLVASLSRPDGNITGVSFYNGVIGQKRLELLRKLAPGAAVIAVLVNPTNPNTQMQLRDMQTDARALGQQLHVVNAATDAEIAAAFATLIEQRAGALVVAADAFFTTRRAEIVGLAARLAAPVLYANNDYPAVGGLMSYGSTIAEGYRQAGVYTARILRGANPADLPVILPTKFELVLNLKTAKTLSLEFPPTLLALADAVIE